MGVSRQARRAESDDAAETRPTTVTAVRAAAEARPTSGTEPGATPPALERRRNDARALLMITAGVGTGYYITAKLGLLLATVHPLVTAVWPPTGVAVAALLLLGLRVWPGIAAAAFLANLTSGATLPLALGISVGNTLAPLTAVALLRACRVRTDLSRLCDVMALFVVAGTSMVISATSGTLNLLAAGAVTLRAAYPVWLEWWVGDAMGMILVTPFLLSLASASRPPRAGSLRRPVESAVLVLALAVTCHLVFESSLPLLFLVFPIVLWAAVRLPSAVVTTVNLVVAGSAIWATVRGYGPFHQPTVRVSLLSLQAFNASVVGASLLLAALVRERGVAHEALRGTAADLEAIVERRTSRLTISNRSLAREIARRWRVEENLQRSEERYRSIVERAMEGIVHVSIDGSRLTVNPAMAQMLGYASPEELRDRLQNASDLLVDPAEGARLYWQLKDRGEVRDFELELRRKDGGTVWTAVHLREVVEADGPSSLLGVLIDIGERRRARDALVAAYENERQAALELERLDRMKDAFLANISHEFRTPITLTLGPLEQILSGRYGPISEEVANRLQVAGRSQRRLMRLVDQLLDLARFEQGAMELTVSRVADVNRLIEEQAAQFRPLAELRAIDLRLRLDPRAPEADLWLDLDKFETLVDNLLANALKFTQQGYVEIATTLHQQALVLSVSDTGPGIGDEELPYVFERFRRASSTSQNGHGTGLGLAIVREIVALHGGEVTVRSSRGQGSCFRVQLPLGTEHLSAEVTRREPASTAERLLRAEAAVDPISQGAEVGTVDQETEAAFDPAKPLVLYVEDIHDLRMHVRDLLAGECNVFGAADGPEGLERARRLRPDLVIVDEMMPAMSGTELVREIRADPELRATPVIFLTALTTADTRVRCLQIGADDYLAKPFHEDELRARIRNLLRARAQERLLVETNRRLEMRVEEQMGELLRTGELRRFLPQPIGDRLLAGRLNSEPALSRSRITVLIAEVAGFNELAERLDPEDFMELVNEYLTDVTADAVSHGGVVDHLPTGKLMILFGVPDGPEVDDHPWSAVQTALAMRARVGCLVTGCRRRGMTADLRLTAGLNTGHATVGVFGSDLLRTYTAQGSVVAVAADLCARATRGQILCGGPTQAAVNDRTLTRRLGPLARDRGTSPVEAFELLDLRPADRAPGAVTVDAPESLPGVARLDPSVDGHVFRREGSYWTIAFEGSVVRLRDSKGLRYLARLLANPGVEFHVLDLAALDRNGGPPPTSGHPSVVDLQVEARGVGEEILDAQARAAYRQRLAEVREEVEEATSYNDLERAARARAELDALVAQLAEATGLGGRSRRTQSDSERARISITKRVRGVIAALGEHDRSLERHLRDTVRTGTFCSYAPDPARHIVWTI